MAELECCVPLVKCSEGQTPSERRLFASEECFCVDQRGFAQGAGLFRTRVADLRTSYRDGVRSVEGDFRLEQFVNSEGAVVALTILVVSLSMLKGLREGVRTLVVGVASWALAVPCAFFGAFVAAVLAPPWRFGFVEVGLLWGGGAGVLVFAYFLARSLEVPLRRLLWLHLLVGLSAVGLVALREMDSVLAQRLLDDAPSVLVMPQ